MAERSTKRANMLVEMERLYLDRAYSDSEMAERLGVHRTVVFRARQEMETRMGLPFYQEGRGRYRLDGHRRLSNVRLTPDEALALYLGGRRLQQQTRTGQKHVASALEKLSYAMQKPLMQQLTAAAQLILEQEQDEEQALVMERLVEGMMNQRKVRIRHARPGGRLHNYIVSPYQLEPAVWGDGVYLICHSDYHDGVATFKIGRIASATVTTEPFVFPADFNSHDMLAYAWGIWVDGEPVTVRLLFSAAATPRVKETIWHPSQAIIDLEDGSCEWQATIAGTREMVPWVRSWGAAVRVIEPLQLREQIIDDLRAAATLYDDSSTADQA